MFEQNKEDLIEYFFRFMISKETRIKFLEERGIDLNTKNMSTAAAAHFLRSSQECNITLAQLRDFARKNWQMPDTGYYVQNLKSGLLKGHDWHGAMPSFLHLSFQNKVRQCCGHSFTLEEYIEMGKHIALQEFFIVVTHDLCESQVINSISNTIPSIANKGVSDFIFEEIPYDLKNSSLPTGWLWEDAKGKVLEFAKSLYLGADTERLRKQAENSINDWGLNRFYVIVRDIEKWISEPEWILGKLTEECKKLGEPIKFEIEGLRVMCHIVFIE